MKRWNGQAKVAVAWAGVSALGITGALIPLVLKMDGMKGGYALAFCGGVTAAGAAAATLVHVLRARVLARLLSPDGRLVYWKYSLGEQRAQADRECDAGRRRNRALFRVVAVACLAIALLYLAVDPDAAGLIFLAYAGALVVSGAGAEFEPRVRRRRRLRGDPEGFISLDAAYVLGTLHAWSLLGARIEDCGVVPGTIPTLNITYVPGALCGWGRIGAEIPVPPGEEARASDVVRALRATLEGG